MEDKDKSENQEFLQFSPETQEAIVGWMLTDYAFFLNCKLNVDYTYFTDPHVAEIVKLVYQVHESYKRHPRKGDIETALNVVRYNASEAQSKLSVLNRCMISKEARALDMLSNEMTAWKKLILLRRSFPRATTLYNTGKFAEAASWLRDEMDRIVHTSFTKEDSIKFDDGIEFYSRRDRNSVRNRCTLGHPYFDDAVFANSSKPKDKWVVGDIKSQTNGSLVPGSSTMLIGPSNAGKTTTIATILFYNLLFERKVLLVTLEELWEDMKHYINQCITGLQADRFNHLQNDQEAKNALEGVRMLTANSLVYIDGVRSGKMFVEDIISLVEIEQEKMKNVRAGERQKLRQDLRRIGKMDTNMEAELLLQDEENRGFDLIIVDYPGKLKARTLGKSSALHEEQSFVYNKFVELSIIHRFHSILPVQTNREGYKVVNNKKDQNDGMVVDQGHIANSFGIAQVAANVITINRGPTDVKHNRVKYYIAKSRTAPATGCFVSKTDFSRRRAFGIFGLTGGLIKPGDSITDESVCQALGEGSRSISELPRELPVCKDDKPLEVQEGESVEQPTDEVLRPPIEDYEE